MRLLGQTARWTAAELEVLIGEVGPELLAYLTRRTNPVDDAADVLAETLMTIWRRRADVPMPRDRARAWMFVVARNLLKNHERGRMRRVALADRLRESLAGYDEAVASGDETAERVAAALACLPDSDQELITLIIWDGLAVIDAGRVMGLSPSTARSRYARAKARFARALASLDSP